jgi:hypothetical protein
LRVSSFASVPPSTASSGASGDPSPFDASSGADASALPTEVLVFVPEAVLPPPLDPEAVLPLPVDVPGVPNTTLPVLVEKCAELLSGPSPQ